MDRGFTLFTYYDNLYKVNLSLLEQKDESGILSD